MLQRQLSTLITHLPIITGYSRSSDRNEGLSVFDLQVYASYNDVKLGSTFTHIVAVASPLPFQLPLPFLSLSLARHYENENDNDDNGRVRGPVAFLMTCSYSKRANLNYFCLITLTFRPRLPNYLAASTTSLSLSLASHLLRFSTPEAMQRLFFF